MACIGTMALSSSDVRRAYGTTWDGKFASFRIVGYHWCGGYHWFLEGRNSDDEGWQKVQRIKSKKALRSMTGIN